MRDFKEMGRVLAEAEACREHYAAELSEAMRAAPGFQPAQAWLDRHPTIRPDPAAFGRQLLRDLRTMEAIDAYLADTRTAASLEMARDRAEEARRAGL